MRRKDHRADQWWTGRVRSLDVGRQLRLVPYWEPRKARGERKELIIDPGPSFGAGDHPTTVMALELLEQAMECLRGEERPPSLLDVGTGTGVLAIAGKALGSGFTVAFDPDPAAVCAAGRNFQLNGLWSRQSTSGQSPCLFVGGIEAVGPRFDLVLVNLVAPVLLRLLDPLAERVDRGLILSGIADPMAERTFTAFGRAGLRMTSRLSRDGWNAALLVTETWE